MTKQLKIAAQKHQTEGELSVGKAIAFKPKHFAPNTKTLLHRSNGWFSPHPNQRQFAFRILAWGGKR